jgi:hypothetical protein
MVKNTASGNATKSRKREEPSRIGKNHPEHQENSSASRLAFGFGFMCGGDRLAEIGSD